jgi:hypothetical protein
MIAFILHVLHFDMFDADAIKYNNIGDAIVLLKLREYNAKYL